MQYSIFMLSCVIYNRYLCNKGGKRVITAVCLAVDMRGTHTPAAEPRVRVVAED